MQPLLLGIYDRTVSSELYNKIPKIAIRSDAKVQFILNSVMQTREYILSAEGETAPLDWARGKVIGFSIKTLLSNS